MHIFFKLFIYLFLVVIESSLLCGLFSSCGKWGPPSSCGVWASPVAGHGL